jgi:hypothetical protein
MFLIISTSPSVIFRNLFSCYKVTWEGLEAFSIYWSLPILRLGLEVFTFVVLKGNFLKSGVVFFTF